MDTISIRYGESLTLPLDADDITAVSADIFIGQPQQTYTLTKHIALVAGIGTFVFSPAETSIPLGSYSYQINVTDSDGDIKKFPAPNNECAYTEFPQFIVGEALDQTEVIS